MSETTPARYIVAKELASLRAELAKEKERADGLQGRLDTVRDSAARRGMRTNHDDTVQNVTTEMAERECEALRATLSEREAEIERLKAHVESVQMERDAWIGANHKHRVERDQARAALDTVKEEHLAFVEAAHRQLATMSAKMDETHTHRCFNCERTVTEETARRQSAALAAARRDALEEAATWFDIMKRDEWDPDSVARYIRDRALSNTETNETKRGSEEG